MKQRPVQPVHDRHLRRRTLTVRLTPTQLLVEIAPAAGANGLVLLGMRNDIFLIRRRPTGLQIPRALASQFPLILAVLGGISGAVSAPDLRDREDGFPGLVGVGVLRGRVAEAGGGKGAFRPPVVDAGEVPVYLVGRGVAVELIADVDEVLDGGYVDVVDGAKVEDYGFQSWFVVFDRSGLAAARAGVVPWSVLDVGG